MNHLKYLNARHARISHKATRFMMILDVLRLSMEDMFVLLHSALNCNVLKVVRTKNGDPTPMKEMGKR